VIGQLGLEKSGGIANTTVALFNFFSHKSTPAEDYCTLKPLSATMAVSQRISAGWDVGNKEPNWEPLPELASRDGRQRTQPPPSKQRRTRGLSWRPPRFFRSIDNAARGFGVVTEFSGQNTKGGPADATAFPDNTLLSSLDSPYFIGLQALWPLHDLELDRLPFLQALEAARLDGREVHKHVFTALPADESYALASG
jgi:hypothetical protein